MPPSLLGKNLIPIGADASTRRFMRAENGIYALYGSDLDGWERTIIAGEVLSQLHFPTPKIIDTNRKDFWILFEDLGDLHLSDYLNGHKNNVEIIYERIVHFISNLKDGREIYLKRAEDSLLCLDRSRLYDEMCFFMEHFISGLLNDRGINIKEVENELTNLVGVVSSYPTVLAHRDCHSENIMISKNRLCFIDFQDSLMAPRFYDIASLLRDSYTKLDKPLFEHVFSVFLKESGLNPSDTLYKEFHFTTLQRNLKALGTFGYQITRRKKNRYLKSIKNTIPYITETCKRYSELEKIYYLLRNPFRMFMEAF